MNIKKFMNNLLLATSIFSFSAYAMEEGRGGSRTQEYIKNLMDIGSNIIKSQSNIIAAYNAVSSFITNINKEWLNDKLVQTWLFDALYNNFMPAKYEPIPVQDDYLTKSLEAVTNNAVYDAIKLIVDDNVVNKELAFEYFFKWMGFDSTEQLMSFIQDESAINAADQDKINFLKKLIEYVNQHPDIVRSLVPESKEQPLHIYARNNNLKAIQTLLKHTPNISKVIDNVNEDSETPLHITARNKDGQEVTKLLLDFGANPHIKNTDGETPLHLAAAEGNMEQAKSLVEHHAILNSVNSSERDTPLHLAAREEREEMVKFLLEMGADPSLKNSDGRTAAEVTENRDIQKMIEDYAKKLKKINIEEPEEKLGKEEEED